ncbi:L,D-transpeptidase family protein [Kitasatospora sp. NPDC059795]|uniref:L,D-transpeptidase family protein n=1 Tax=Kitasatospora sp. NPDC059795 TaxID=3346949 RepID=UPI00364E4429
MSGSHRAASHRRPAPAPAPWSEDEQPQGRAASRRRRKPKPRRAAKLTVGTATLLALTAGWFTIGPGRDFQGETASAAPDRGPEAAPVKAADSHTDAPAADRSARDRITAIPGLGASWTAKIPAETRQVLVASGKDKDSSDNTVTLWTRGDDGGWQAGQSWPAHNAYKGWTTDHHSGDLRSPIGMFSLTDAGGRDADPGSKLPYDHNAKFVMGGRGFNNEPLAGSFDYVVAINYNRVVGASPLDGRFPEGAAKGGGIWLHLDHGGPTHGCISLTEDHMVELIKTLDPALHPMIVMGDAQSLAA